METYQITKYDPSKRDSNGHYPIDEWTAISDIGKIYNNLVFTKNDYLDVENRYISAINDIARHCALEQFKVQDLRKLSLEKNDYEDLYTASVLDIYEKLNVDKVLNLTEILIVSRLMLREDVHGTIEEINLKMKIEFGYDYYMYVTLEERFSDIVKDISSDQKLFIG